MIELPDAATSRAVLIGVHTYHVLEDLPAVRQNLVGLRTVFTDQELWGLPGAHCAVLDQPGNPRAVLDQVRDSARQATDTLIVYYAGHGSPDVSTGELCLALPDSDPEYAYTMLRFDDIRRLVLDPAVRARRKVVVLDCCYSGRALPGWMDAERVADQTMVEGSCVLTASAETRKALSPAGEPYTAFTGELIATLVRGVPGGPALLDMETVYRQVRRALEARSWPVPQQRNRNAGGMIALVRNAAAGRAPAPAPVVADTPLGVAYARMTELATTIGRTLGPYAGQVTVTGADRRSVTTGDPAVVCELTGGDAHALGALVRRMRAEWSDGAATAVVLASAMMAGAVDAVARGANPRRLAVELAGLASTVHDELVSMTAKLEFQELPVEAVVFTATADRATAHLLATALDGVGRGGKIRIEEQEAAGRDHLVVPGGMFLPGPNWHGVLPAPSQAGTRVAVFPAPPSAEQVDDALRVGPAMVLWPHQSGAAIAAVGGAQPAEVVVLPAREPLVVLEDIAALTGATIAVLPALGVTAALSSAGLLLGTGVEVRESDLLGRIHQLRRDARNTESAEEREFLETRAARLGNVEAYVFLGRRPGETDREFTARKRAVGRARDVLRPLLAHGLLPGGGVALRQAAQVLGTVPDSAARSVLLRGLSAPATALLVNHGWSEADLPVDPAMGVDVASGQPARMAELGIVDTASVVVGAFDAAVTTVREFLAQDHDEPAPVPRRPQETVRPAPPARDRSPRPRQEAVREEVLKRGDKPHVTIGTLGHIDHGKTTLTAAISQVLHDRYPTVNPRTPFDEIDRAPQEERRGVVLSVARIEYQTEKRHYAQVDCPGHADHVKNMIIGATEMDGAILVVAVPDGVMPQTREHVLLARQVGVRYIVVALNKADLVDDEEILELIELEVRELLAEHEFPADDLPVIRVSATGALAGDRRWVEQVERLVTAVDEYVPSPSRAVDLPFLMAIEDIFTITGRGTVVTGRVERGVLATRDEVEILGLGGRTRATVAGIEAFRKILEQCQAGDNVGVLFRGVKKEDLERGQVLATPGTTTAHTDFEAQVVILSKDEGGRHTPFFNNYRPRFYFRTTDVTGVVTLPEGTEMVMPGDNTGMTVKLVQPIAMDEGQRFAIRENGRTVGAGRVVRVIG